MTKKKLAEQHLAGVAIGFLESGGKPDVLLRTTLKDQYDILLEALDILEWHEAAGRVRAWIAKNGKKLWDLRAPKFKEAYKEAKRKAARIPGFPSKDKILVR